MEPNNPAQLDYGADVPLYRRRWVRKWAAIALLAGVMMIPASFIYSRIDARRRLLVEQRNYLEIDMPASQQVLQIFANGAGRIYNHRNVGREFARDPTYAGQLASTLFVHSRRNGIQPERLIIAEAPMQPFTGTIECLSAEKATFWHDPTSRTLNTFHMSPVPSLTQDLTIWAGQIDPDDSSHFTIGYDLGNQPGKIDGYLLPDGSVKLSTRGGPITITP